MTWPSDIPIPEFVRSKRFVIRSLPTFEGTITIDRRAQREWFMKCVRKLARTRATGPHLRARRQMNIAWEAYLKADGLPSEIPIWIPIPGGI